MPDAVETFTANSMTELFGALKGDLADVASAWWKANKSSISGHVKVVAQAAVETQKSLAKGTISQELADFAMQAQQTAFKQIVRHSKLMTLVLLQNVVDAVFRRVGWAIKNKTGFNLFPDLVPG